ncbi:MAG: hypothetical protein U5J64_04285 [Halobacteriales archaeon]|nr:hypothetical protein [Halobacteriales archaeon]
MDDDTFERGHVVWHPSLFKDGGRPYLILSDGSHPFHGKEYIVVGVTTTEREEAVVLTQDNWKVGGLPKKSYVSPWFVATLKHAGIDRGVGALSEDVIEEVGEEVSGYVS